MHTHPKPPCVAPRVDATSALPQRAVLVMAALACAAALWTPEPSTAAPANGAAAAAANTPATANAASSATSSATSSAPSSTTAAEFSAAQQQFLRASEGDDAAIEPAAQAFAALLVRHPGDPVLTAYAGAATAMRARSTLLPWKKMNHAEAGLALLDKALASLTPASDAPLYRGTPASLETRFVACNTFLAMPAMFNRQARGEKLLQSVLTSPLFDGAPLGFKASVWLRAGSLAGPAQPDEARRLLGLAARSDTPSAAAARAKLKELGL